MKLHQIFRRHVLGNIRLLTCHHTKIPIKSSSKTLSVKTRRLNTEEFVWWKKSIAYVRRSSISWARRRILRCWCRIRDVYNGKTYTRKLSRSHRRTRQLIISCLPRVHSITFRVAQKVHVLFLYLVFLCRKLVFWTSLSVI